MALTAGAVLVAAGEGRRLGAGAPKAWVPLGGRPLFLHSLEALHRLPWIRRIVLVMHPRRIAAARRAIREGSYRKARVIAGGKRRQDSVVRGVMALPLGSVSVILVHDAARPYATGDSAERVARAAVRSGAALAAIPVTDTLKRAGPGGHVTATVKRGGIWRAQTPQAVRADLVPGWLKALRASDVSDDVTPLEEAGLKVKLVPGSRRAAKITVREDLEIARGLAGGDIRAGLGFDMHRLARGRPLVLGGVRLPYSRGLVGHSDADIVCHALADALLGASCGGDMGIRFGIRRKAMRGISSHRLLAEVVQDLNSEGWSVAGADVTVMARAPRMGRYRRRIAGNVRGILGVGPGRVSIKATTAKGMGEIGAGEAMACFSIAVIRRPG